MKFKILNSKFIIKPHAGLFVAPARHSLQAASALAYSQRSQFKIVIPSERSDEESSLYILLGISFRIVKAEDALYKSKRPIFDFKRDISAHRNKKPGWVVLTYVPLGLCLGCAERAAYKSKITRVHSSPYSAPHTNLRV